MRNAMADVLFDLFLPHGRCVGVALPAEDEAIQAMATRCLLSEERAFAATLGPARRRTWVGGRVAMRSTLARLGQDAPPILADERGAPVLPTGVAGSISHKGAVAVALVAVDAVARLGIDLEIPSSRTRDIAARVLRPEELAELEGLRADERASAVLLRFSAKEAVYKALDPFVRRYVGFLEIAVSLGEDGSGDVVPHLRDREGPFAFSLRWTRREGLLLTTATVAAG
jgi:enterobactin synthetase component D